ncbi:O-antigen ligase family protein [Cryobacterium sp. PH31-O1]|uniref:O-antigen ligase family protein n=1 Tax=Cryobacterium sp. PH31-O1 TaxID=3046306 RepID=UPI0024B98F2A|nr:O-antigen ligase family protein [Cryobacterium sp. PH31-O1]MDJ0338562.1 O-antigen ligase family protein [Cryobacterium sp. PH31-O1]
MSRWILPKDALLALAVVIGSLSVARGRLPRWFVILVAAAGGLLFIAVLASANPAAQLWGSWPRYEGLVALPVYLGAVWLGARLLGPRADPGGLRTLHRAVIVAAALMGFVSLLEAVGLGPIPSDLARPGAFAGNATDQGIVGALCVAMLMLPMIRAWAGGAARASLSTRLPLAGGVAGGLTAVIVSASRAAVLAIVVVAIVVGVSEIIRLAQSGTRRGVLRFLGVATGAIVLVGGAALAVPLTRSRLLGASPLSASSLEDRFFMWSESLKLLALHPLTGVGPGGFVDAIVGQHDQNWYARVGSDTTLDSPHNWLLQAALDGGVLYLAVIVAICGGIVVAAVRRWRSLCAAGNLSGADFVAGALAAVTAYAVALLTHFTAPATAIFAALLCGALISADATTGVRSWLPVVANRVSWRRARSVLLALWLSWLVLVTSAELPLQSGIVATRTGNVAAARASFELAQSLRPWDASVTSIAAQSFTAAAAAGVPGALPEAVNWGELALVSLPSNISAAKALAAARQIGGDLHGAEATLRSLAKLAPFDASVARQLGDVLAMQGDSLGAEREYARVAGLPDASAP